MKQVWKPLMRIRKSLQGIERPLLGLGMSLIITLGLCSCGSDASSGGTAASDPGRVSGSDAAEQPLLTIFDKNVTGQKFDDAVAQVIMEKTGVRIELVDATNSPDKALEMMLVKGNYPDIILMEQVEMVNQFIEANVFIPLDKLIAEKGPNITAMYGDVLDKSKSSDGRLYWLANWYGEDTDASAGVLMRKDYLIELVGEERANSTEPFTLSEYTELLRSFKERYGSINGKDPIALDIDSDADYYEMTMKGIFGMKTYGVDEKGILQYLPSTERYQEALLYLNTLYTEGLLCDQWMLDRTEKWKSDLKSGAVFSTWCSYWDTDEVNAELRQKYGSDAQFFCYKVVADDLNETETTFNGRNSLGWDAIGITSSCQDTDAAMRLLDFLASEEGQYLLLWGVEGETWEMVDQVHVPNQVFLEKWSINSSYLEKTTGVRRWKWTIKNGNGSDGTPYDLTTKYSPTDFVSFANARFLESDYWDTAEYSGLEPSLKSDYGLQWQKIETLSEENFARIICASDQEEALRLYDKMVSDMELTGLEDCEKYITRQYNRRIQKWGLE